jgi:hypothetical protein
MKKWLWILVIAGGIFYGYRTFIYEPPVLKIYENLMNAYVNGNCGVLRDLTDGQAREFVENFCTPHELVAGVMGKSMAQIAAESASNSPWKVPLKIESESYSEDGNEVSLVILEKSTPPTRQATKMKKSGETWKVIEFPK